MGKQRLGGNKSETRAKRDKAKAKKRTMAMEKESARSKEKAKIVATAMPSRSMYEAALAEETTVLVGRAVVLAHGTGGSSSHASMKAWKKKLSPYCDDVLLFNFPKAAQMPRLAAAFTEEIARARSAGHKRIVVAGVGSGARVALHLLSSLPVDEGDPIEPLPKRLRDTVVGTLGLGYPLLRAGSDDVHDAVIRGLPAGAPPLLLLSGSNDPHAKALESALTACAAQTELVLVEGADQTLSAKPGTQVEREVTAAIDSSLGRFLEQTLGSAEAHSKKCRVKLPQKAAPVAISCDERFAQNVQEIRELRAKDRHEQRLVNAQLNKSLGWNTAAAPVDLIKVPDVHVSGCGSTQVNGTYRADGVRDNVASYRQVGGQFTLERDSAVGQATQWCLCVDYGFTTWAFIDAEDDAPPSSGWSVSDACKAPPPTIAIGAATAKTAAVDPVPSTTAQPAACQVHVPRGNTSLSSRRKKRLLNNGKIGIKKKRKVKLK